MMRKIQVIQTRKLGSVVNPIIYKLDQALIMTFLGTRSKCPPHTHEERCRKRYDNFGENYVVNMTTKSDVVSKKTGLRLNSYCQFCNALFTHSMIAKVYRIP
ncbi:hypothetical protein T265_05941 [Opisthorchis viverrini]|uniref:Uncharacterized protein n=1 Tax=Opisthorchis viverrini TaxID=6198 RepID=A0A074ZHW3_OPIVI|nr:hypothetical protein T265_05941 [Opisthorchis viverrini]KER26883.1 hypothetical protein T265_05941 [Opisthorchis viverrini]